MGTIAGTSVNNDNLNSTFSITKITVSSPAEGTINSYKSDTYQPLTLALAWPYTPLFAAKRTLVTNPSLGVLARPYSTCR